MPYTKPYVPVKDQITLLTGRGMVITDAAKAASYLERIGYYRLSGYWYPYRKSQLSTDKKPVILDDYKVNTLFSEIVELYVFDKKLRMLMLDAIERIEIAIRVQITLTLGRYDPLAVIAHPL